MLDEAYDVCRPDFLMCTPRCKFYSISSSRRDRRDLLRDREKERPALVYMQNKLAQQVQRKKYYVLEQPWSSAMWTESLMIHNQQFHGYRKAKRTDQCAFGACDEHRQPVLKATSLEANFKLRVAVRRCNGHRGVPHTPLQGQHNGINRTAMAAVYPQRFCKALIEDVIHTIAPHGGLRPKILHSLAQTAIYYKCERCELGRAALPGTEHTYIPGECRYGRKLEKMATAAPSTPSMASSPLEDFKRAARSHANAKAVTLTAPADYNLSPEDQVHLKYLLCKIVEDSMSVFEAAGGKEYHYWLTDPSLMMAAKHLLRKILYVFRVHVVLHPFAKPFPEPHLSAEQAPL